MMKYFFILTLLAGFQLQANQSYFLTAEEVEAGFAIRDIDTEEDDAALAGDPKSTASEQTANLSNGVAGTGSAGGGGATLGASVSATAAKVKAALSSAVQILAAAAPAIAKVVAVATVATVVLPIVVKVMKGVLAVTVGSFCHWMGLSPDISVSAAIAAPIAVENAAGWLKTKFLSVAA